MPIDKTAEAQRIARKVLKVEGEEYDMAVDAWCHGYGVKRDVDRWQIAVEVAYATLEALGAK